MALTHHQPVDGKERMRGHGALLGAADTTVHVIKNDGARLAEVVKSSDHEEGQRIAFTLKSVIVDQDDFGDPVTAPVVVEADAPEAATASAQRTAARIPKNSKLALDALREAVDEAGERVTSNHVPPSRARHHGRPVARVCVQARDRRTGSRRPPQSLQARRREPRFRPSGRAVGTLRMADRIDDRPGRPGLPDRTDKPDTPEGVCPVCPVCPSRDGPSDRGQITRFVRFVR